MEAFLRAWLGRRLVGADFTVRPFNGKQSLLRKLERRLNGYREWLPGDHKLVVIVDRDGDDCADLKDKLEKITARAGLKSRVACPAEWQVAICIAIEELEAWYFGDWDAVRDAYPKASPQIPRQASYRLPDAITGGTWEAFERVMKKSGYFIGGLQKVRAAGEIGARIDAGRSVSPSFKHLDRVIAEAA